MSQHFTDWLEDQIVTTGFKTHHNDADVSVAMSVLWYVTDTALPEDIADAALAFLALLEERVIDKQVTYEESRWDR